jgi:molybdopterin-containing oxidoreductase family iron-sulfur binding subunit
MPVLDRRDFLKLVGVGAGGAVAAGCSDPVEKLIPYVVQPEEITPGLPVIYASTCRECPAACGLHVRTREGRPIKLEGNPEHPTNRGRLCARGETSIGRTYHPDRFPGPMRRTASGALEPIPWDEALALLAEKIRANPAGAHVLGGDAGPTANAAIDRWVAAVGAGGRVVYEPFAPEALREACRAVYGAPRVPRFDLSGADLVIDFGADCLETGLSPVEHAAQLAEARNAARPNGGARLVYVGPRLSMTASSADEWLPAKPGTEGIVALAVARVALETRGGGDGALAALVREFTPENAASRAGVDPEAIVRLGRAVAAAKTAVALPPGVGATSRRAVASAAAVMLLNHAAGSVGRAVLLEAEPAGRARASHREALRLVDAMAAGKVSVLIVHDADPAYSLPAAAGFAAALDKVGFVVSTASMIDETAARAHLVLPDHTPLESWGDAEPRAGVRSLIQPTVRPLFDTRALVDALLDVGRAVGPEVAARLPEGSFRGLLEAAWAGGDFRKALARGGAFAVPAAGGSAPSLAATAAQIEVAEPLLEGDGELALLAHPHPFLYDGRGANLPWLQEIPDPVTKVTWQSWAEISRPTAERLGVEIGDVLALETPAGRIEVPALPRGGLRDDVVAVAIGQGHAQGHYASLAGDGQPGEVRGASVISVLPSETDEAGGRAWLVAKARVSKTGRFRRLPLMQFSDNKRGRKLGEVVPLAALAGGGEAHGGHGAAAAHGGVHEIEVAYDPAKDSSAASPYRWGMSIDLDRCTGCSACVAACYVENAIPVVGEPLVLRARMMSWLRIERWIGDGDATMDEGPDRRLHPHRETFGSVDVRHSPMLCQQCGAAPCEPVCPVLATYHNPEGLNGMVYNRCVGTRYCSNNCPYKVRRFNYFDYSRENWPGLLNLMMSPDVTVRQQGVMEKCTFCVQRIEAARQTAKDEGRPIRDGEVRTACQQACPTEAIRFGNVKDPEAAVTRAGADPVRGYHALHVLNTRPAITYLAKVTRGPVEG